MRLSTFLLSYLRHPCVAVVFWLCSGLTVGAILLGSGSAFLIGFSKTGIPGAGMPAITLMANAFREETKLSVGAMVPLLILGDMFGVLFFRRHANWPRLLEVLPYIVLGMVPGYVVLQRMDSETLRVFIGILILVLVSVHVACQRLGWQAVLDRKWFTGLMGLLAGFGTVVGNAAGPAMSIYLLSKKLDKHEFIGTSAWLFFLVNSSKVPFQMMMGVITAKTLRLDVCVVPVLIVGVLSGVIVHERIPQKAFDTLVLLLTAAVALQMIWF
ncbi:MAG: sulfite exporter TauE/SafE family protein [Pirellulaceae bacterium]